MFQAQFHLIHYTKMKMKFRGMKVKYRRMKMKSRRMKMKFRRRSLVKTGTDLKLSMNP